MREVSEESYLKNVETQIECDIEDVLFERFNRISDYYKFEPVDFDTFHSYYWDGYAGPFRELAIKLFEWLGMDVTTAEREELREELSAFK